jgi:F0F1-type ATP synthase gamma subunit
MQPHLQQTGVENKKWPAPIIETDPVGILRQINLHFLASSFYQVQLKSMIAESSSRFRIMEEAKQNAGDIMTALSQEIQAERKRQITQEMQELAVGAGLIDNK